MLGFLESPKSRAITNEGLGFISEDEILKFSHKDCNDYLVGSHTKKELVKMRLKYKKELILFLEYNYQNNSF
jgi:hypothetical protein